VAAGLALWAGIALSPLVSSLPPAVAAGSVVRRLHGELAPLASGWTGYVESSGSGASTFAYEWSYGPVSTIDLQPRWRSLSLDLQPVTCPDGAPQRIVLAAPGGRARRVLVLGAGYHWYQVPLGWLAGAGRLALTYRCVVVPASLHDGDPDARPLAVAIAGLAAS